MDAELEESVGQTRHTLNCVVDSGEQESELTIGHPENVLVDGHSQVLGDSNPPDGTEVSRGHVLPQVAP